MKKFFKFIDEHQSFGLGWFFGVSLTVTLNGQIFCGALGIIISTLLIINRFHNLTNK